MATSGHVTKLGTNRGMYPLCEDCWSELSVEGRLPFYKQLLGRWDGLDHPDDPIPSWEFVQQSVVAEARPPTSLQSVGGSSEEFAGEQSLAWKL